MPRLRIEWANIDKVKLYSVVEVGLGMRVHRNVTEGKATINTWALGAGGITLLGFSAGDRLFVFGEFGPSTAGVFKAGLGYKF